MSDIENKSKIIPVLSINASDSLGHVGIQADIRTITSLGLYAVTAITSIDLNDLPSELIISQVRNIVSSMHPKVVKLGLIRDAQTIKAIRNEVIGAKNIVVAPGIFSSNGEQLIPDDAIETMKRHLIPIASILILRSKEAEKLLNTKINTDDDMIKVARTFIDMGAESVLLRTSKHSDGLLTTLLYENDKAHFFTSHNTEGWQKHGIGGALSSAIASRLAYGDDIINAIENAHDYMHKQVVYAVSNKEIESRKTVIYNQFLSLLAKYYNISHSVSFYADKLCVSTRYLSQITNLFLNCSPKDVIDDYILKEAKVYIETTNLSIQEIAYKLGFSSQTMFSIFFKRKEKCSPVEFRTKS